MHSGVAGGRLMLGVLTRLSAGRVSRDGGPRAFQRRVSITRTNNRVTHGTHVRLRTGANGTIVDPLGTGANVTLGSSPRRRRSAGRWSWGIGRCRKSGVTCEVSYQERLWEVCLRQVKEWESI